MILSLINLRKILGLASAIFSVFHLIEFNNLEIFFSEYSISLTILFIVICILSSSIIDNKANESLNHILLLDENSGLLSVKILAIHLSSSGKSSLGSKSDKAISDTNFNFFKTNSFISSLTKIHKSFFDIICHTLLIFLIGESSCFSNSINSSRKSSYFLSDNKEINSLSVASSHSESKKIVVNTFLSILSNHSGVKLSLNCRALFLNIGNKYHLVSL
ncbi:hypothetical protein HOG21_06200 [bacterium]|nr:hypothetical protein [bacterium]